MFVFLLLLGIGGSDAATRFYLLTCDVPTRRELTDQNLNLVDSNKITKFIIHGWLQSPDVEWCTNMTKAFLYKYDCNVIQVDWRNDSKLIYPVSANLTGPIGKTVGDLIVKLITNQSVSADDIHICGHSLGAHISGFAGKDVQQTTGTNIDRISGLDPAGPLFQGNSPGDRLSDDDANFVDVTHSDSGYYGYDGTLGTVDFMPNNGTRPQPGCEGTDILFNGLYLQDVACSHIYCLLYFTASLYNYNMTATKCDSYNNYLNGNCNNNTTTIYGDGVARNVSGVFYFQTVKDYPYVKN